MTRGPDPSRDCEQCGVRMTRYRSPSGRLESLASFKRRRFCSESCRRKAKGIAPHGTLTRYQWHRCRCDLCRGANTSAARARAARVYGQPVPDHVAHGTHNAAFNYGCTCDPCRAFRNQDTSKVRARANSRSLGTARRHNQVWTGPELEILARPELGAGQVAEMLGRSLYAVRNARVALRRDPEALRRGGFTSGG